MRKRKLFWQLYPSYVIILIVTILATVATSLFSFRSLYYKKTKEDLKSRTFLISTQLETKISKNNYKEIQATIQNLGDKTNTRITVMLPDGKVIADNKESPEKLDNHANRSEVKQALAEGNGLAIRYSNTLKESLMYFATLIGSEEKPLALVRSSIALNAIRETLWGIYIIVFVASLFLLVTLAVISWWLARRMSQPLEEMKIQAKNISRGNFSRRILSGPTGSEELHQLGDAINEIAVELNERIKTLLTQKSEQEAIFSSMSEGILALDNSGNVKYLNEATAKIFDQKVANFDKKNIFNILENDEILSFIKSSLRENVVSDNEFTLVNGKEKFIEIQSSPMRSTDGNSNGAVLVLSDNTRLKKLESHRKDFVANVSHELKTPLTSIQGYAELLMNPEVATNDKNHFISVIQRHASRLQRIIEDLLSLSRIERDTQQSQIELTKQKIRPTMESAIELCEVAAKKSNISIALDCDESIYANINSPLLEQAIVNLLSNAIKYSKQDAKVEVRVSNGESDLHITVTDHGLGIPEEKLPRIFERFYRVDKARSRELGGTGLGLSIVKHVSLAHKGSVNVESILGAGSIFSIHLPSC